MRYMPCNYGYVDDTVPDFDVLSLRIVRAIGDTGSITAAADALGYSQPAISQHLRRLETRLGVAMVERVGRGVRLTEAGRVLARHATAVTVAFDAAAEELAQLRGLRTGLVRLVAFPSASPVVVPRLIATLAASHPGLSVTYLEAEPPEAVAAIREDRADIALTFSYPGDRDDPHRSSARGLTVRSAGRDDLMLLLPAGHDGGAVADAGDRLAGLADATWIAGCPRCRGHLLELCGRAGFEPRIAYETDNYVAVEGLVAQGIGVATLPRMAIESFPLLPGIVTAPLPSGEARRLHVVTAQGADRVPSLAAALSALGAVLAGAGAGSR